MNWEEKIDNTHYSKKLKNHKIVIENLKNLIKLIWHERNQYNVKFVNKQVI